MWTVSPPLELLKTSFTYLNIVDTTSYTICSEVPNVLQLKLLRSSTVYFTVPLKNTVSTLGGTVNG